MMKTLEFEYLIPIHITNNWPDPWLNKKIVNVCYIGCQKLRLIKFQYLPSLAKPKLNKIELSLALFSTHLQNPTNQYIPCIKISKITSECTIFN